MSTREKLDVNRQSEVSELIKNNQQSANKNVVKFLPFGNEDIQINYPKKWKMLSEEEIKQKDIATSVLVAEQIVKSAKDFLGSFDEQVINTYGEEFIKKFAEELGSMSIIAMFAPTDRKDVAIKIVKFPEKCGFTIGGYEKLAKVALKVMDFFIPLIDSDIKISEIKKTKVDELDAREFNTVFKMEDKEPVNSVKVFTVSNNEIYGIHLIAPENVLNEYYNKYFTKVIESVKFVEKPRREKITRNDIQMMLLASKLQRAAEDLVGDLR